jgi:hypothetical protein
LKYHRTAVNPYLLAAVLADGCDVHWIKTAGRLGKIWKGVIEVAKS